jgi:NAD(P)-dependent dehydrogenase (short-subunit alcohol dehydrogenase family)
MLSLMAVGRYIPGTAKYRIEGIDHEKVGPENQTQKSTMEGKCSGFPLYLQAKTDRKGGQRRSVKEPMSKRPKVIEPYTRVAVVTGAGRGIGLEVARRLAERGLGVVLTSPDQNAGKAASAKLLSQGLQVRFHILDVVNEKHIRALLAFVMKQFGRIDVLVNDAGVMFDSGRSKPEGLMARRLTKLPRRVDFGKGPSILEVDMNIVRATLEINTLGALSMCQVFVPPMMKAGYGRVVNVSSSLGQLNGMTDEERVPAYQLSKAALNAVTLMVADAAAGKNVTVNSVCPGWTRTDLGGPEAPQSVGEAAETILWLATRPDGGPTGGFFRNKRRIRW